MSGPRTLVLATRNPHKVAELRAILEGLPLGQVASAAELDAPDVVEDAGTLTANALKKARELAQFSGQLSLADDTGLEVDALDGAPGVYSARWAGEGCSYADNCNKLLAELDGVPAGRRGARFRTVMALVDPDSGAEITAEGSVAGTILDAPRGEGGFGYDPLFYLPDDGRTLAEMDTQEKNRVSHRARAAAAMREELERFLTRGPK